ncbi:uncharacterized protein N7446_005120 [Penicillium canescens]|uniref:Conidiation-specific protein 6 n=1 Tax=Penicillium canescens TaxID=5083 RepID=A0AAD6I975_PENCN|nr:uncharacterized protein N7446_005120 [Penicillium canescens]KAJ6038310.1 hypothetical protein N7460_008081 [Penicillium canescens]KAJ6039572.1 hypothetical protein N7444_008477 [Penicillium canescens]KAJ6068083.1 hypothetical protein N7446_005120 [Penicillium canescens]
MSGHKTSLNNSNVSDEGKGRTQAVPDQDQDAVGYHPHKELYNAGGDQNKDLTRVTAGLRATQNNPVGINKEKTKAYEELIRKGGETPEG